MAKSQKQLELTIPPPVHGVTDARTQLDSGFCLDMVNFDVSGDTLITRPSAGDVLYEGHDISGAIPAGDAVLICDDGMLKAVTAQGVVVDIAYVGDGSTLDYAKYGEDVFFATESGLWKLSGNSVRQAGVPLPTTFPSLPGGDYQIAMSIVDDGVESGAVIIGTANIGDPITLDGHNTYRLYIAKDSEVFRQFAETSTATSVQEGTGAECVTLHADAFPAVERVAWYGGRLLAAKGNIVYFSLPFNPHLRDKRYGHFEFSGKVRVLKPLGTGAVVADDMGVWFLDMASERPSARRLSSHLVPENGGVNVDMSLMEADVRASGVGVALLTKAGHIIVTPDLQVVRLTSGAVTLDLDIVSSTVYVDNNECRRIISAFDTPPSSVRRLR